ncbi:hypothetical protein B4N89_02870 [Embleya scabrispora]|uniref:Uncharacterized protein n=1 Tax=Embleya scabrispora TaxID=159449 RepID=A0A1T3NTL6_9ACTN|nr:hypothetical protein [Embleya scabrispora]OPC80030.1 hypothetical protein B4N89_02870 [Embleya scabrispora]
MARVARPPIHSPGVAVITVFIVTDLLLVVGVLIVFLGLRDRARTRTATHDGLRIERDNTTRAEASGGVLGVHTNHGSWPGV